MSQQIRFFRKNFIDIEKIDPVITVSDTETVEDGSDSLILLRNRNNVTAWATSSATAASVTTMEVNLGDIESITDIILVLMNFKNFTVDKWDTAGEVWVNVLTETTYAKDTAYIHFDTPIETNKIRIVINDVQDAFEKDRFMSQLIITEGLLTGHVDRPGQLLGWPKIKKPRLNTNKKANKMLSGKVHVNESVGGFQFSLTVDFWRIDNDLSIVEDIYNQREGVLVWLAGGDEDQFASRRIGYRNIDIFLMRPTNDFEDEYVKGIYVNGLKIKIDLAESVT